MRRGRLGFYLSRLFRDVDLKGKRVLDIGGGCGILSFYAVASGARASVCLEPDASGSHSDVYEEYDYLAQATGIQNVELVAETVQDYEQTGPAFDVILLHNSVNHCDEEACARLATDEKSRETYRELFRRLRGWLSQDGTIVVCDCTRHNLFDRCGTASPFAPTIDWAKHQSPNVWRRLLEDVGFGAPVVRWSTFGLGGRVGELLLANRFVAFVLFGHFQLVMRKENRP